MLKARGIFLVTGMLLFSVVFSACVGVKSEIWILDDGSGKIQVEYRMPSMLIESLKESEYGESIVVCDGIAIPGNFCESAIRDEIAETESLTLTDYTARKQGEDVYVFFEIAFTTTEDLYELDLIPAIEMRDEPESTVLEQVACCEFGLDRENPEVVDVYKDYKNSYIVHAPRPIFSYNRGELSKDGKTLVFEYSVLSADACATLDGEEPDDKLRVEW